MCGIVGIIHKDPAAPVGQELLKRMCDTIVHRGPDGEGYFTAPGIGLGHRRLSIIDLEGGSQPMGNEDGQVQITFNGEIYNFQDLQSELEAKGHTFRTRSDTESIVHLYEERGDECVEQLRGMFAFGIWDGRRRRLLLARDRIGQKPLFYYEDGERLIFASEMKAILEAPGVPREVDPESLDLFLAYQYVPHPRTIFRHIKKVPPAHILVYENGKAEVRRYWDVPYRPDENMNVAQAREGLSEILTEATRLRMIADVPLGAFLSGGIDSSLTVALMSQLDDEPVRTFSIGFEEQDFSEVEFARMIAKRYGTKHEEFIVRAEAADVLPKIAWHYDEPFADASALPTYYVSKVTAEHVKVALSGDAGDENFCGYLRYHRLQLASMLSGTLGRVLGTRSKPPMPIPAPGQSRGNHFTRARRLAMSFLCHPHHSYLRTVNMLDRNLRDFLYHPDFTAQLNGADAESFVLDTFKKFSGDTNVGNAAAVDLVTYLPCAILTKVDIASMAHSLEVRSPFLDHKLVEFAATIPTRLKMRLFDGKFILKETFRQLLPPEILARQKMGFGIPINRWMAQDLYDFLTGHLLSETALSRGYFDETNLKKLISDHHEGRGSHGYNLWPLLMLELWHQQFVDGA
jgi:asparagine synthase (glutamine-hydrolysing)